MLGAKDPASLLKGLFGWLVVNTVDQSVDELVALDDGGADCFVGWSAGF